MFLNAFLGRFQIRAIRSLGVKRQLFARTVAPVYCILIKLLIWPTEKQPACSHFYFLRLLAISKRRHIYLRSYPNGHKLNKFLHLVAKRQKHFVLTLTCQWWGGGGAGGAPRPHPPRGFLSFFLDDKTSEQHLTFSIAVRLSFARTLRQV